METQRTSRHTCVLLTWCPGVALDCDEVGFTCCTLLWEPADDRSAPGFAPLEGLAPLTAAQLGSSAGFSECPMEIEMLGPSPTDARYHYQPEMHRLELRLEAPEE